MYLPDYTLKGTKYNRLRNMNAIEYIRKDKNGGKGKAFELICRSYLTPNSTIVEYQNDAKPDIYLMIDGKKTVFEVKSGNGKLATKMPEKSTQAMEALFTPDFVIYSYAADINNAIVLTRDNFLQFLYNYDGRGNPIKTSKYKEEDGSIMYYAGIQSFNSEPKQAYFTQTTLEQYGIPFTDFFKDRLIKK